jgi:hypothetical protein
MTGFARLSERPVGRVSRSRKIQAGIKVRLRKRGEGTDFRDRYVPDCRCGRVAQIGAIAAQAFKSMGTTVP